MGSVGSALGSGIGAVVGGVGNVVGGILGGREGGDMSIMHHPNLRSSRRAHPNQQISFHPNQLEDHYIPAQNQNQGQDQDQDQYPADENQE